MEESKLADFQRKSVTGNLTLRKHQNKTGQCQQKVPHTFSDDNYCRFGDTITVTHDNSGNILACDPYEDIFPPWNRFQVSAARDSKVARARSTFRISRPPKSFKDPLGTEDSDEFLKYGQPFSLACNESLLFTPDAAVMNPPLYLSSSIKNDRNTTKSSNRQCVYLTAAHDSDTVWTCMRPSSGRLPTNERYVMVGHPVDISTSFVLVHSNSNSYLKTDAHRKEFTDFGVELEVCAERTLGIGKLSIIVSEFQGTATAQTLTKPDVPSNLWHFGYASSPEDAVETREFPPPPTVDGMMIEIRRIVLAKGIYGLSSLRRHVEDGARGVQDRSRGTSLIIHREDARQALISGGIALLDAHLELILDEYDKKGSGYIDMAQVIGALGESNPGADYQARDELVEEQFARLSSGGRGISYTALLAAYRPGNVPYVLSGDYTESEALQGFREAFYRPVKSTDSLIINLTQFLNFYRDVGASIRDDEYFRQLLEASWR